MSTNFKKARFSIEYGPQSLFDRVKYKMSNIKSLTLTKHCEQRLIERNIPIFIKNKIENFLSREWHLKCCEVRTDKGKFVNSTWEYTYKDNKIWITIGFGNVVETIVVKESLKLSNIIKDGAIFNFVNKVNSELMKNI